MTMPPGPSRILIIGGEAAGKTSLARRVSERLGAARYELDSIAWQSAIDPARDLSGEFEPNFQSREPLAARPLHVRREMVADIASRPSWVVEGIFIDWTEPLFAEADAIVWLDQVSFATIVRRVLARHARSAVREVGLREGTDKFLRFRDYGRAVGSVFRVLHRVARFRYAGAGATDSEQYASITRRSIEVAMNRHRARVVHVRTPRDLQAWINALPPDTRQQSEVASGSGLREKGRTR